MGGDGCGFVGRKEAVLVEKLGDVVFCVVGEREFTGDAAGFLEFLSFFYFFVRFLFARECV